MSNERPLTPEEQDVFDEMEDHFVNRGIDGLVTSLCFFGMTLASLAMLWYVREHLSDPFTTGVWLLLIGAMITYLWINVTFLVRSGRLLLRERDRLRRVAKRGLKLRATTIVPFGGLLVSVALAWMIGVQV